MYGRRLGVKTERSGVPHRESKPSAHRHRTARIARTTRQINGAMQISVSRAKPGGLDCSPRGSRKLAPSPGCPFLRFEQGNIMVFLWTCPNGLTKIRVSWIYVHLSKELQWFGAFPLAESLSHQGIIRVSWIYVHLSKELQWFGAHPLAECLSHQGTITVLWIMVYFI